jgi:RsiW-degrading membrane proteinase PrsW (M82 family)
MLVVQAFHWALALVPVIVMLAVFVSFDVFKLMSLREILFLLIVGGFAAVASYPVSGRLLDTLPIGFNNYSRYWAPWIEEAIKGVAIVALFRLNRIGFKLDAVLSGFAVGAGFSVIENIIYLVRVPDYGAGTWLVRGLGTAVMHGTTLAILATTAHELAEREMRDPDAKFRFNLLWFLPGYLAASLIHLGFNQFPDRPLLAMLGAALFAPLAILAIFHFGTAEAHAWIEADRERHREELAALQGGLWPKGPAGDRVAAFARRGGRRSAGYIKRYWELQAFLVLEAEETLMEEAGGDAAFDQRRVAAAFDELAAIRKVLGRATIAQLERVVPFSRNDHWEIAELRQRLRVEGASLSIGSVEG